MAETTNKKQSNPDTEEISKAVKAVKSAKAQKSVEPEAEPAPAPELELSNLLEGFTSDEVAALVKAKEDVGKGRYSDITNEHRKLLFVKWLVEHDKLAS